MAKIVAINRDNLPEVDYLPICHIWTPRAQDSYVQYFIIHKNNRIEGV